MTRPHRTPAAVLLTCAAMSLVPGLWIRHAPAARAAETNAPPAEPATTTAQGEPAGAVGTGAGGEESVLIEGVPHVVQKPDFCGEACAEMALRKLGKEITQDDVFNASGLDPLLGRGCYTADLVRALKRIGFKVGSGGTKIDAAKADTQLAAQWQALHADLARSIPSIVCMHYSDKPQTTEHFRLVLGYDATADEMVYHEPAEAGGAYRRMKRETFLNLWPLKYNPRRWSVIRLPLVPGTIRAPRRAKGFTDADYAQHMMDLKKKVPAKGFTVVLERPFFVIGDQSAAVVRRHAAGTVRRTIINLKKDYFKKDPDDILDIWLFKDKASYEKHVKAIFNDTPTTPFGYCSHRHGALIMNIATGGGTLVHEMVHPFVRSNFPACPSWFNEGLASLYEQSTTRAGHIVGLTNWRLAGLQKAINAGRVPSFKDLTATTDRQFYHEDPGTNYGQARYLCYWLQEQGKLVRFYHAFRDGCKDDPTGYATLQETIGTDDMDAFKKQWEAYVLKLRFP